MKKQNIIIYVVFILVSIIGIQFSKARGKKYTKEFHQSHIEGIVTDEYSSSGGTRININNEEEERDVFLEYNNEIKSFFSSFVAVGDSVYKAPNGEFLFLFRGDKQYQFQTKDKLHNSEK